MFSRFSIRDKIAALIGLLLLGMVGLGVLAVFKMRDINAKTVDIQENWLPSVRALGELRAAAVNYRSILRGHLLSSDVASKTDAERRMQEQEKLLDKAKGAYEKLIASPEERAIYRDWATEWSAYTKIAHQVAALSRAHTTGGQPVDAIKLNESQGIPQGRKADALIEKDVELNDIGAATAGRGAAADYAAAFNIVILILTVATVAGIGIGIIWCATCPRASLRS